MNLKQILLEIKNLNVYSPEEWEEYIGYFLHSGDLAKYIVEESTHYQSPGDTSRSLISRILDNRGAEPQKVDTTISAKIVNTDYLSQLRDKKILGIVSGAYDLLHLGHIRSMVYAKQYSNPVLCGLVLSDENIRAKKGESRPILNINERLEMLCNVECIDYVVPLNEPNCLQVLEEVKPDYFFKDKADNAQGIVKMEIDLVKLYGGSVVVFPPAFGRTLSTTKIIEIVLAR